MQLNRVILETLNFITKTGKYRGAVKSLRKNHIHISECVQNETSKYV